MSQRRKLYWLTLIAAAGTLIATGLAIGLLYQAALQAETSRLSEAVRSQARLIEAVSRYHARLAQEGGSEAWKATVLAQVAEAHEQYKSFGETGEFMLGRREGDRIVLLLRHTYDGVSAPAPETASMPFGAALAQPMQAALSGRSGTMLGVDCRGEKVVAAYAPVAVVDWGIVANIHLAEIRAPFVRAGAIVLVAALFVAGIGAILQFRVAHPVIERLEATEAQARAILNSATDGVVSVNERGIIESFNPAAERIYGYSTDEVIGRSLKLLMPPGDHEAFDKSLADYLRTGEGKMVGASREVIARRKDGSTLTAEVAVSEMRFTNQRRFSAIIRDITAHKRAAEAIQASETRYRRLFETAQDGILILDEETGAITDVNPFMKEMLGYSREEFLGKRLWEIGPFRDTVASSLAFDELRKQGYVRYEDLPLQARDGHSVDVEFVSNVYAVNHHRVIQCNIRNITARKRVEMALQKATAELAEKNAEMEQILYTVSHDLKSPLVTIQGFGEYLSRDAKEGRLDRLVGHAHRIQSAADRMGRLIDDLLKVCRLGRVSLNPAVISLADVLHEVVGNHARALAKSGISVVIHEDLPPLVGDRDHIHQVFDNLLVNAIKYGSSAAEPKIELGAVRHGDEIRAFVKDNGKGIPQESHDRVFDLFCRLHQDQEGAGAGLAIVKRIVEMHGGRVWVDSAEGQGATFWLAFPAHE